MSATAETRIEDPDFIRTLMLKFHSLNPLNRNAKRAEIGMVLIKFISCCLI